MAESWTEVGLNYMMNAAWRNPSGTSAASLWYVGLFTSATPTTVPASTATGSGTGWTEITATSGTYTRQGIAASAISAFASVGASSWGGNLPAVTFTGFVQTASPANGWGLFNGSVASTASPYMFANFDSAASYAFATSGASLILTPAMAGLP